VSFAVDVVEETERAQALLQPARLELLERLREPGSAAAVARDLGLPRQRVNYHLRELEENGLVELVEERRRGSCVERVVRRTGDAYAISPAALGRLGTSPDGIQDRFSAAYQIALASRTIRELGALQTGAREARKKLPTLALEVDVRFASAAQRNAFADELADAVARLVSRYHDERAPKGRVFRFHLGAYPRPRSSGEPR
jgi:DNA-binding transcriptional ArsR family regulator